MRACSSDRQAGFSLVEVALAMGIVSLVLIVILGLFASLSQRRHEVKDRREASLAAGALQVFLEQQTTFSNVYSWLASTNAEFVHMTYRADSTGMPNPNGTGIRSRWGAASEDWTSYEAARDGVVLKAILNRMSKDPLPDLSAYTNAYVEALASIYPVPERIVPVPTNTFPSLTVPLAIMRK